MKLLGYALISFGFLGGAFTAVRQVEGVNVGVFVAWLVAGEQLITAVAVASLAFLALLGGLAARAGGASVRVGAIRATFWSSLAMLITAAGGSLFGVSA